MTQRPGQAASAGAAAEGRWHVLDAQDVLAQLHTGQYGPSDGERAARLACYGPNTREGPRKQEPWWQELGESLAEPLQLLLIAVAVLPGGRPVGGLRSGVIRHG